ncbi:MAG: DNA polymerase/3'-5' exonuclease PolX [Haloferacaceae archaeon]
MSRNDEVARRLEEFADLLAAKGVEYKPNAYRRAADNVREHPEPIEALAKAGEDAVAEIDRVGDAIAGKIVEYVQTGAIEELDELREELPVDMPALTSVSGVGPKTVGTLYEALGITTLEELEAAAEAGEIREVEGFGEKTEQNILENIPFARQSQERTRLGRARPIADDLLATLREHPAVETAAAAGSIRRWRETVGDVDALVASTDGPAVLEAFAEWEAVDAVVEAGTSKGSVRADGMQVDLRVVAPDEFGSALQYFTGSKDHNVRLRNLAIDRGLKMNEYGVFDVTDVDDPDAGQRVGERIAGETEAEMYGALDLPFVPPELREDRGEIAAAEAGELPDLVEVGDVRGDLHTHTDWSDGRNDLETMVAAAADRGYDYYAIADHAEGPGIFGDAGLTDGEIREQADVVAELDDEVDVELLHGIEANVDADGNVTTDDDVLAELDVVVASPHSALDQSGDPATDRLCRAIEHPHVDVLGHPTGRIINSRPGLDVDLGRVVETAAERGVALEVNANPARLDLDDEAIRRCVEADVPVAVNTDAHSPRELEYLRYGVHTARRGWAETADVLNAREVDELRAFLEA